ncbi:hypothetical protein H6784_02775 [Candidatus Nomurabacteria bacterium]|nr:hypothetical protein [Candidatus Nomurabacteria bacterium]
MNERLKFEEGQPSLRQSEPSSSYFSIDKFFLRKGIAKTQKSASLLSLIIMLLIIIICTLFIYNSNITKNQIPDKYRYDPTKTDANS